MDLCDCKTVQTAQYEPANETKTTTQTDQQQLVSETVLKPVQKVQYGAVKDAGKNNSGLCGHVNYTVNQ